MRMTIDPIGDVTVLDVLLQLYGESAIDAASGMLRVNQSERRHVVGHHDLLGGGRPGNGLLQEGQTACVLGVEAGGGQGLALVVDAIEIADVFLRVRCVFIVNRRPKGADNDIGVAYVYDIVVVADNIGAYL